MSQPQPIREPTVSPIKYRHPELYGKLLEVDKAIQDVAAPLLFVYLILLLAFYCSLWFEWYKSIPALAELNVETWLVYILVFVVVAGIWLAHAAFVQRRCYQRHREEILDLIHAAGISRYRLLAALEGDKAVRDVSDALKRDRWNP
jgi:hypothetical protein